jgi:hypothetical protein
MTDLLRSPATRTSSSDRSATDAPTSPQRPLALGAAVAGAVASGAVLLGCMALGLVGWFASDAGAHGDTKDAIRVGADGWLLAHGAHLELATGSVSATITVIPLGLTLLCAYVAYRLGSWAALTSAVEDARGVLLGAVVLSGIYAVVALATAILSATAEAEPGLLRSFVGGFVVAFLGGGAGLLAGSRAAVAWTSRIPVAGRSILAGVLGACLLLLTAGSLLLGAALLLDLGAAANVLSRLHADASGGLLYTVLVAAVAPNAVLLTGSYLLGPGFAVGTGTIVSSTVVVLGPLPMFPLLAALPDGGPTSAWTPYLMAVPPVVAGVAAARAQRRHPTLRWEEGGLRGCTGGVFAGLVVGLLAAVAGGAVGPGRMQTVEPFAFEVLVHAITTFGIGGLFGGLAMTWWQRRTARRASSVSA